MKKFFVGVLAIAGLVACTQEEVLRTQAPGQIAFESAYVDNAVRALEGEAAVDGTTTTNNLQSFDVWGFMNSTDGVVFDREAVKKNDEGAWAYANVQYWLPSKTYRFFAVSPAESANIKEVVKADYDDGITVEFTNVAGTEDLLYANAEGITTPSAIDAQPAPVHFGFEHLLSKVKFTFVNGIENENAYIKVTNIKMTVPNKGTVALDQELKHGYVWENLDGTTTLEFGNLNTADGRVAGYNWAQSQVERLTIPAAETQEYTVTFDVALYMGGELASEDSKSIKVSHILFEPGKAYNLKATLDASNVAENALFPITFTAEVDGWVESTPAENDITSPVYTAEELAARLQSNSTNIVAVLQKDIDLPISSLGQQTGGSGEYKLGGKDTKNITIDLNGHTLNVTTTYWSILGAKNENAIFTIKNGKMTSSQATGTWNSYDLGFDNCNYVLENVEFLKAIALCADAKNYTLNNVKINETHAYYAMWVRAAGSTVTINGLEVVSAGRGIKIDEQYISAPEKVTLNVTDAEFTTASKSAILVKSAAGAEINLSNVDITAVAADSTFPVWVDEDAAAYADLVVVKGGLCKVEGAAVSVVETSNDLIGALEDKKDVILTDDVTVDKAGLSNAYGTTGVKVYPGQTFDGNGHTLDVSGAGATWDSAVCISGGTVKNLTVTGAFRGIFVKGNTEKVVLKNVTTTGTTYTISCDSGSGAGLEAYDCTFLGWTSYAKTIGNVKFVGCHFGYGSGYKYCRPYAPTEFVNCDFVDGFTVDARATITFENCTYAGAPVTAENLSTFVARVENASVK